ncbi:MAG TPA: amidohydrolase family protein [Chitinophagaceae bacterium]|nr:amidohydrolase family protein [Chitinophagaceae bacterium]
MNYRKFRADRLFDGYAFRQPDSVLITDPAGRVQAIVPESEAGEDVEYHPGLLTPGLVNCHCHLELSHLKDVIPPHTGLIEFLCSVVTKRDFDPGLIQDAIRRAEQEMYANGIVAVGDIGNTADTARTKAASRIRWQNFVEVLGFTDERAQQNLQHYRAVASQLEDSLAGSPVPHRTSLVPHAPYSISPLTFRLINEGTAGQVISLHNQEHPAEDELYRTGQGDYLRLFRIFGLDHSPFPVTGRSSLRSVLPHFTNGQTLLLVHNTYMPQEDILFAAEYAAQTGLQLVYCFCPNANRYIENRLPDVGQFLRLGCRTVLGTDSYSSNWQLSVAREIRALVEAFPGVETAVWLRMATLEGARALRWEDQLGSFEPGKTPGVVRIEPDFSASQRLL